jgi:hypothetical protein
VSGLSHPVPERVKVAAVMAAAVALGAVAGGWYLVRDRIDGIVDLWMRA